MFKKKIKIHIYKNEISLVLKALNEFRNQGAEGLQSRFLAMWLTKGNDGYYHVVIARQGDMNGISTENGIIEKTSGLARCNFAKTASETNGWAWVNGPVGVGEDWVVLYTGGETFTMANKDDQGNTVQQVPIYYNWFTNSGKMPIGSICKLIDVGVLTPGS